MDGLLDNLVTLLRAQFTANVVEKFYRLEAPTALVLTVHPNRETRETGISIGPNWAHKLQLDVTAEIPWDDKETTGDSLIAAVETVKGVISSNRTLDPTTIGGLVEGTTYTFVQRPGRGMPCLAAIVSVTYRTHRTDS